MAATFGGWLITQGHRHDWIGMLASQAASDPGFPKRGDAEAARKHLVAKGADPDQFEMLEDAEAEWLRRA